MKKQVLYSAFTLTEVLIAVGIVGVIAALVIPALVNQYQEKAMQSAKEREVQTISGAIDNLAVAENKADFFRYRSGKL